MYIYSTNFHFYLNEIKCNVRVYKCVAWYSVLDVYKEKVSDLKNWITSSSCTEEDKNISTIPRPGWPSLLLYQPKTKKDVDYLLFV